jgi:multidrug resistance efflux pump
VTDIISDNENKKAKNNGDGVEATFGLGDVESEKPDNGNGNGGGKKEKFQLLMEKKPVKIILLLAIIAGCYWGYNYWNEMQKYVFIEKAQIIAPSIEIGPGNTGILEKVYVSEGDSVKANQLLATIGDEYIRAEVPGIVTNVNDNPGQIFSRGQWIIKMIDPKELRIIGRIEEDKGLKDVREGQTAYFTVDAFGNDRFDGEVQSVSQTSREGDVVFSISDKREEKEFNIKVQYDHDLYTSFRNGMSARLWVSKGQ